MRRGRSSWLTRSTCPRRTEYGTAKDAKERRWLKGDLRSRHTLLTANDVVEICLPAILEHVRVADLSSRFEDVADGRLLDRQVGALVVHLGLHHGDRRAGAPLFPPLRHVDRGESHPFGRVADRGEEDIQPIAAR